MVQALAKKLVHTGPAEKERVASVPQRQQLASTPEPPLPKGKRNRAVSSEYQIMTGERVKNGRELHLGESEGDQSGSMECKGWTPS